MQRHQIAAAYYVVQAIGVAGWWLMLAIEPSTRVLFAMPRAPAALLAFAPGDIAIVVLGSAYVGVRRGRGESAIVAWMVTGAMLYGALYTITVSLARIAPPLGALLMTPASMASVWAAVVLSRRGAAPRLSSSASS